MSITMHPTPPTDARPSRPSDEPITRQLSDLPRPPISLCVVTIADRPDLRASIEANDAVAHPPFLLRSEFSPLWDDVYATFPEHQLMLCDEHGGAVVAHANSVPFHWNGDVADLPTDAVALARRALADHRLGLRPTALAALQAVVDPAHQGTGLAQRTLEALAAHAAVQGLPDVFAPIRPTQKDRYPLVTLDAYSRWVRADGLPQDPWIRTHHRLGATPVAVMRAWTVVEAPLEDWTAWTGVMFPMSGWYTVPHALVPIEVDVEAGTGRYEEPHLWMRYRISL
jgi:GNAT superfamily N-acetyltransferase